MSDHRARSFHRYADRVVVVTGAARGIGRGIARRFLEEDARVALVDRADDVHRTAHELEAEHAGRVLAVVADVTDEAHVADAVDTIAARWGRIDVLVNNAGVITISPIEELSLEAWNRVLAVNTTAAFLMAKACIPHMRRAEYGRIINAASGQARQGFVYTPHYAASKFGIVGFTQSLAKELARDGITVNSYCPGIVGSDMWDYNDREWGRLLGDYQPGELMREWVEDIPIGRAGTADDVADLLLFLASEQAGYITGQAVNIDGGMFMN
jgi:meso-butanediol dehydrogenase / (S,S)-butanediol dehydrogenase / diacetyl reductase